MENDVATLPLRLSILDMLHQAIENNIKTEELVEGILNVINKRDPEQLREEYRRVVENILDEVRGEEHE